MSVTLCFQSLCLSVRLSVCPSVSLHFRLQCKSISISFTIMYLLVQLVAPGSWHSTLCLADR